LPADLLHHRTGLSDSNRLSGDTTELNLAPATLLDLLFLPLLPAKESIFTVYIPKKSQFAATKPGHPEQDFVRCLY